MEQEQIYSLKIYSFHHLLSTMTCPNRCFLPRLPGFHSVPRRERREPAPAQHRRWPPESDGQGLCQVQTRHPQTRPAVLHDSGRENLLVFISSLVSIVGGVFVTVGMLSSCLVNSAKVVAKKVD